MTKNQLVKLEHEAMVGAEAIVNYFVETYDPIGVDSTADQNRYENIRALAECLSEAGTLNALYKQRIRGQRLSSWSQIYRSACRGR